MQPYTNQRPPLDKIDQEGYSVEIGRWIDKSWNIVKENLGLFFGFTLVFFLITFGLSVIPVVGSLVQAIIQPALTIGFVAAAHKAIQQEKPTFSDCFSGFSQFGNLFLVNLLLGLAVALCFLPFIIGLIITVGSQLGDLIPPSGDDPEETLDRVAEFFGAPMILLPLVAGIVLALIVSTLFAFANQYVFFYQMSATEAMQTSLNVVKRNLGGMVGFMIVSGLVAASGALLCGIGLLFTVPISMVSLYVAFASINQLGVQRPEDIEQHLVG
jgi:uncharacterized membrane protein